jgi:hypothetical protein
MPVVGWTVIALLWFVALVLASTASLEFLLRIQSHQKKAQQLPEPNLRPKYNRLKDAYLPFTVQHLHPQYLFFFPLEPAERMSLANEICSVDGEGFRRSGTAHAGGRRLAFLLGGSAAFGQYASSDATTITGYLNRFQDEYFFVNAGVPAWNSTQEMFRLVFQILDYRPALIITYDGANDVGILGSHHRKGLTTYPFGTPNNFEDLVALLHESRRNGVVRALEYLLPELTRRLIQRVHPERDDAGWAWLAENVVQEGAAKYLSNLLRMRNLAAAEGARFIAVFQPVAPLHRQVDPAFESNERGLFERFHKAVMKQYARNFEFHDFAKVFDQYYARVPVMRRDVTDETVFIDEVHLYDPGNAIIARHLHKLIRSGRGAFDG